MPYSKILDYTFGPERDDAFETEDEMAYFTECVTTDMGTDTDAERHRGDSDEEFKSVMMKTTGLAWKSEDSKMNGKSPKDTAKIYVMFKRPKIQGLRAAGSFREYLVNDIQPRIDPKEFVHTEIFFCRDNTAFVSAMNLGGVTFVTNKKFAPEEYNEIFELEMSVGKYDLAWSYAHEILAGKSYDIYYYYFFLCIVGCGMKCDIRDRAPRYTCVAAVATLLTIIGIGDNPTREYMRAAKNITVDDVHALMTQAYEGVIPISKRIRFIRRLDRPADEFILAPRAQNK